MKGMFYIKTHNGLPVYERGTKVKIVTKRKAEGRFVHVTDEMEEEWLGKELTIVSANLTKKVPYYSVKENGWYWDNSLIDCVITPFCLCDDNDDIECASFGKFLTKFAIRSGR